MTAVELPRPPVDLAKRAATLATEIVGRASDAVDRKGRFPVEAIEALRAEGMLASLIPTRFGGGGASLTEVAQVTALLARHCASTAMIYAMHTLQVACLVRHGSSPHLESYLRDLAANQYLLASATTEVGTGGDTRSSVCALARHGATFQLKKQAPVISYGAHAEGILATARRSDESPASDQVLVLCRLPQFELQPMSDWDALGMRGTCSAGFTLLAQGDESDVLPVPFADISAQTMLPVSHILWSHVWLGIATEALDRARRSVQAEARKSPGTTPPAALRLAELSTRYDQLAALVQGALQTFERVADDPEALSRLSFAASMNSLKVGSSQLVVEITGAGMGICGIAGYRTDSPYSIARLLRDAYSASLMVNNDRILANNAQLLLMNRGIS